MHDPETEAFRIPNPFAAHYDPEMRRKGDRFYGHWSNRRALITVLHRDPQNGGDERSCRRRIEAREFDARCEELAVSMARWAEKRLDERYFDSPSFPRTTRFDNFPPSVTDGVSPGDALALTVAAFHSIAWQLERRELSLRHLREAMRLGVAHSIATCFAPSLDAEQRVATFRILIAAYRKVDRPWWRDWRWHFWYWRVRLHFWHDLCRWWRSRGARPEQDAQKAVCSENVTERPTVR